MSSLFDTDKAKDKMSSLWDRVHGSTWFELTKLESEMDSLSNRIMGSMPKFGGQDSLMRDKEFFKDLPCMNEDASEIENAPHGKDDKTTIYHTYSYNSSSQLNDKGERITSIRQRYEDSSGRLKAKHERNIGDKHVTTIWNRKGYESGNDKSGEDKEGTHEQICSSDTTVEEFEKEWSQTPFGKKSTSLLGN